MPASSELRVSLEGRTAVVTGGSAGIGRAIALRFASEGARVIICARNSARVESCVKELRRLQPECLGLAADVTSEPQVRHLAEHAYTRFGEIHILVNNAGVYPVTPFADIGLDEWREVMGTNVDGPFLCARIFAGRMIASGTRGRILNISSTSSLVARPGIAHYAASKAALNTMTRVLALEMAPHGITVNALCPGVIQTETVMERLRDPEGLAEHRAKLQRIPLGRLGTAEEVAAAALFLISDEAAYITGACVVVDGGYTLGIPSYRTGASDE